MRIVRCKCSRCQYFVRANSDSNDTDGGGDKGFEYNEFELKKTVFETREYQTALIELAKNRNIVACLPTGSGKTFIAFKLIEYYQADILSEKKKVIFLANTIPLVNQQAAFFARNTGLKVKHITGDMEVDYWSEEKWNIIFEGFEILAMTTQIFLNILRHAYVKVSQIALLILDECHHAVKEHPMKLVMQFLHETEMAERNYPLPRVLGMTATIIKGNCEPRDVPDRVSELERTMKGRAVTYKDFESVLKHSTNATVMPHCVPSFNQVEWADACSLNDLKSYSIELNKLRNERRKQKAASCGIVDGIDPTLRSISNIYLCLKKPSPGDLRMVVDDVRFTCENLGLYCGVIAINLRLAFIEFSLMDLTEKIVKEWYIKIRSFLTAVRDNIIREMAKIPEEDRVLRFTSPKLKMLIKVLETFREAETSSPVCEFKADDDRLCGIVFTDRRVTAQVLSWYFQDLANSKEDYSFIRANFVVGTSRCPFETVESRIYAKKQTETIVGFRNKRYNLIIATSVLEEGIDVPSCNMVLRFDKIPTFTSFVQSMGRARKKDAQFIAFIPDEFYARDLQALRKFEAVYECMVNHLISSVEKIDEEVKPMSFEHDVEPFRPGGTPDSPSISMESAMDVVDRYCQLLPCDGIASLQTICWWIQVGLQFVGHLKLPMNGIVRGTIVGAPMRSKDLAKQAVFFEAAKRLYEAKALDDNLLPVRPAFPHPIDTFFKTLTSNPVPEDETEEGEVADKTEAKSAQSSRKDEFQEKRAPPKSEWYEKKVPRIFKENQFSPGKEYKVYRISFKLTQPKENYDWQELYKLDNKNHSFGVISAGEIPEVGSFPLYGGFGCMLASLTVIPNYSIKLTPDCVRILLEYQDLIFTEVLDLFHPLMTPQRMKELSYVIVPLIKEYAELWKIPSTLFTSNECSLISDMRSMFAVQDSRRPAEAYRAQYIRTHTPEDYRRKYQDAVVVSWYKGKKKSLYCVDSIAEDRNPRSKFNDENYTSYQHFIETEYKTQIYDLDQPLLKCKLAGVGKGRVQLNYLLEKVEKEDQFPVYLVPELLFHLPIAASSIVQLKLLPSFLHRLNRLLLVKEIVDEMVHNWPGLANCYNRATGSDEALDRLTAEQDEKRKHEEQRREAARKRFKKNAGPIPEKQALYNRELHYEFIHPNKITPEHIKLFHEAVSSQHAAKKIILSHDTKAEMENGELSVRSTIELTPMDELNLKALDHNVNFEEDSGPSLLALMEALTLLKSNDGASNQRLSRIGQSIFNFIISTYVFRSFPDWSEPLMCQLRNRILTIQFMLAVAKRRNIPEILSASDFYPGTSWLPPGFKLMDHIGSIAAENKVNLEVYDGLGQRIKNMSLAELEAHVRTAAPALIAKREFKGTIPDQQDRSKAKRPVNKSTTFSSYTHTEILDNEVARGLNALVGAFFKISGMSGCFKFLEWLGFPVSDSDGKEQILRGWSLTERRPANRSEDFLKLIPGIEKLEETIQYRFNDLTLLAEALTHPSYFANNLSDCYQRLEFLGDAILDAVLTNFVFAKVSKTNEKQIAETKNPNYNTTELSEIRLALVNNITYASLAVRYELQKYILSMSKPLLDMIDNFVVHQEAVEHEVVGHFTLLSDEECWGPKHMEVPKVLGDVFEALAGAIYIDSGYSLDTTWKVFYRLMENEINEFSEVTLKSPYHELEEAYPGKVVYRKWTSNKMRDRGRDMVKIFVESYGHYFGSGTNVSRAKEASAKIALKMIKEDKAFTEDRKDATELMLLM